MASTGSAVKARIGWMALGCAAMLATASAKAEGQTSSPVRSLVPSGRRSAQPSDVPESYLPPAGMCRIWIDNVPAAQQPAPTDCASAIKNRPSNGRVVFPEDGPRAKRDEKRRDGKDARDPKDPKARKP